MTSEAIVSSRERRLGRRKAAAEDPCWALARSTAVSPTLHDAPPLHTGVIEARPHPTGWFVSGRHRPDLSEVEIAHFTEFVAVRTYLLLTQGPSAGAWTPGSGDDDWVAWSVTPELDPAELVPDALPSHWS